MSNRMKCKSCNGWMKKGKPTKTTPLRRAPKGFASVCRPCLKKILKKPLLFRRVFTFSLKDMLEEEKVKTIYRSFLIQESVLDYILKCGHYVSMSEVDKQLAVLDFDDQQENGMAIRYLLGEKMLNKKYVTTDGKEYFLVYYISGLVS